MIRLKASRYNHFVPSGSDFYLGYNFLYRSVLRVPSGAFLEVDRALRTLSSESAGVGEADAEVLDIPPQWQRALSQAHFLIEEGIDELSFVRFRYYRSLYANDRLSLVVLPTLWCNLDCPYCFEFKKPIFMSPEIEDKLIEWVRANFSHKRRFHVAWFGGEPLLGKATIFRLTERLREICAQIGATYGASMTTNGVLLDPEFQAALGSLGITSVQITLDGDKHDHDLLRKGRDGRGSFDQIYQNILSLAETENCTLTLRVNCGDHNYDGIENLLNRFPLALRRRVKLYFRWIWSNVASGFQDFAEQKRGDQPFKGLAGLYALAAGKGWQTQNPHNKRSNGYCEVDFLDHYEVDPEGNLYLCSHTFDPAEAIGSLRTSDEMMRPAAIAAYARWYAVSPFSDDECLRCKLLPVCLGGCRKSRVEGTRECIEERESLDLFVENLVSEKLGGGSPRQAKEA